MAGKYGEGGARWGLDFFVAACRTNSNCINQFRLVDAGFLGARAPD